MRLPTLLRRVLTCWVLKTEPVRMPGRNIVVPTWPNDYNIMQHPQMLHDKFDNLQFTEAFALTKKKQKLTQNEHAFERHLQSSLPACPTTYNQ